MRSTAVLGRRFGWFFFVVLTALGGTLLAADAANQIPAQIAAGEFGPAIAAAEQLAPPQRDPWLARIAAAQGQAGAAGAALATAAEISGDVDRTGAIQQVTSQPVRPQGAMGGQQVDFDTLTSLIKATIAPPSWDDTGGQGSVQGFPGGVYVDASGALKPIVKEDNTSLLSDLRSQVLRDLRDPTAGGAQHGSGLRKISLTRLEKEVQLRLAAGAKPTSEMAALAGLQRIRFVLVYPEQGEVVLAGPAGGWVVNREGRWVNPDNGHPVVHLDDLVVVLRQMLSAKDARFGCSINPTQEGLARMRKFAEESTKAPLKEGQRDPWLARLREQLGDQDIDVYGIDPRTHAGRVMVEADYRMKLVGLGLEESIAEVPSYLSSIPTGKNAPPLDVLRWWFTLNYDAVKTTADRNAFALHGQGVKVQCENELLDALGQRVHTGASDALNQEFAHNFTQHFPALARKYPVYAELQNIFDLALVGALLREEHLPDRIGWHLTCFGDPRQYQVELAEAPKKVASVINHRLIDRVHIVAAVSGGVTVEPAKWVDPATFTADRDDVLKLERNSAAPPKLDRHAWWWD